MSCTGLERRLFTDSGETYEKMNLHWGSVDAAIATLYRCTCIYTRTTIYRSNGQDRSIGHGLDMQYIYIHSFMYVHVILDSSDFYI